MNAQDNWVRRVMTVASFPGLKAELQDASRKLGFDHFVHRARFPTLRTGFDEICLDNCPPAWRRYYLKERVTAESDPLRSRAMQQATPILWREVFPSNAPLRTKAAEFGFGTGVIFPVHGPAGQWTALTLIKKDGGVDAERAILSAMAEAHLLAVYAHEAGARILRRRMRSEVPVSQPLPGHALSTRERECLVLAASGKTAVEIGKLLSITERTVGFHLGNARQKLGTESSQHAVIRAVSLGLIAAG